MSPIIQNSIISFQFQKNFFNKSSFLLDITKLLININTSQGKSNIFIYLINKGYNFFTKSDLLFPEYTFHIIIN